jgi:ribosomal protein S27E
MGVVGEAGVVSVASNPTVVVTVLDKVPKDRALLRQVLQGQLVLKMDSLMEASFSPISKTGNYITKCGVCQRYMRHLNARPQRLYCQTCAVTYALPQGGSIKQYSSNVCPLDGFELLIYHVEGGKSIPLCPHCYNKPPFEDKDKKVMSCADCNHVLVGPSNWS